MDISKYIDMYQGLLNNFAEVVACTLELVGIFIIVAGSAKALIRLARRLRHPEPFNVVIDLGKSLALALEFKMGAEIINTVIIRDLKELAILAIVILIRALLAVIIHWEIKMEKQADRNEAPPDTKLESK